MIEAAFQSLNRDRLVCQLPSYELGSDRTLQAVMRDILRAADSVDMAIDSETSS
ncbi:hypothetical protein [Sporisorium scitamineum]|uniref:Uncharacterized protein n=1 Tax=Sporisorium scitamineum TaxID=49012 RepID=A0A0F7SBK7_9BASI|nr:hypothetical protein [Sporisorium scitamineum]